MIVAPAGRPASDVTPSSMGGAVSPPSSFVLTANLWYYQAF